MRTKTLFLAAAALVAGLVSSQADAVYSQNVVGYINISVGPGSFYFLGNQLTNEGSANAIQVVLTNGVTSDGNANTNTFAYIWDRNAGLFNGYAYYTALDADNQFGQNFGNGWYDGNGNLITNKLNQGTGNFVKNGATVPITLTLSGTVPQGTNYLVKVTPGFNTYCYVPPVVTNIFLTFPSPQSDGNAVTNDVYYLFNPGTGLYKSLAYYTIADADNQFGQNFGNGWYDGNGNLQTTNAFYWPAVGQAFFINHPATSTNVWQYGFNVQ